MNVHFSSAAIQSSKSRYYYALVMDRTLERSDLSLIFGLLAHRNRRTEAIYPSVNRLARLSGFNRATLFASLRRLKAMGYVNCIPRKGRSSKYEINFRKLEGLVAEAEQKWRQSGEPQPSYMLFVTKGSRKDATTPNVSARPSNRSDATRILKESEKRILRTQPKRLGVAKAPLYEAMKLEFGKELFVATIAAMPEEVETTALGLEARTTGAGLDYVKRWLLNCPVVVAQSRP